jgi:hypothetical protein
MYQSEVDTTVASSQLGPVWNFLLSDTPIDENFAVELEVNRYYYFVVDKKITTALPMLGAYFSPVEEESVRPTRPVPEAWIERWRKTPYATRVYDSDQTSIYRLDARYAGGGAVGAGAAATR